MSAILEYQELVKLVETVQCENMITVEVGCWVGDTLLKYIDIVKRNNGKAYVVDLFSGNEGNTHGEHAFKPGDRDIIYEQFLENTKEYKEYIEVIRVDSSLGFQYFKDNSIDLCFIDADHRYYKVYSDIITFLPKIKIGKIICGHDYPIDYNFAQEYDISEEEYNNPYNHLGVGRAVNQLFKNDFQVIDKAYLWYSYKK